MRNTILLALDDSRFSRAATDEVVRHLRSDQATIHVLHVLELDQLVPSAHDFARGADYGSDVMAHVQRGHVAAQELVDAAAACLRDAGFEVVPVIKEGDARHVILDYAKATKCDCIVLGSHGRRGLDRFFMGSVSDAVARHAHCSVHIVRIRESTGT